MARVILSSIAYHLGRPRLVEELPEIAESPPLRRVLTTEAAGLKYFMDSDESVCAMATRAARQTLDATDIAPADIDVVVIASDSTNNSRAQFRELAGFLGELGLERAYPFNVSLCDCANLIAGIAVAHGLVASGEARNALVVAVDLARLVQPQTRVIGSGLAVASDGAASALVSSVTAEGFAIESVAQLTSRSLMAPEVEDPSQLTARVGLHRDLFEKLFAGKVRAGDVTQVFPSNFTRPVLRVFLADSGFTQEQLYLRNVGRIGHCLSCDSLINLRDYMQQTPVERDQAFVLLGSGVSQLGAVLLRATDAMEPF
jgi:3-oxoacyl-[acyl-carrier-protein] synthase-3